MRESGKMEMRSLMAAIANDEEGGAGEGRFKDHLCVRCGDPCNCEYHMDKCSQCMGCQVELSDQLERG